MLRKRIVEGKMQSADKIVGRVIKCRAHFATSSSSRSTVLTHSKQCVYTQSHAYMTKIPMTYHEAPTTNFRLFWDADSWNFSNIKTINAFRTLWLLPVLAPFFKVSIVKDQRFHSVANSQLVPNDFQLLKALSHLGLVWK